MGTEILNNLTHNTAFIVSVIAATTPVLIKIFGNLLTHRRSQQDTINQDVIINAKESDLKHQTDSDLVFIFKHHNGGVFYDGKPMEKMTMCYVRSNSHINIDSSKYLNIPISYFGDMVYHLYNKGYINQDEIFSCNGEDDLKDSKYRNMMLILGMKSHYATAVYKKIWKINSKWDSISSIFLPIKKEKVLVASIHWCAEDTYQEKGYNEKRIQENRFYGRTISDQLKEQLLKK